MGRRKKEEEDVGSETLADILRAMQEQGKMMALEYVWQVRGGDCPWQCGAVRCGAVRCGAVHGHPCKTALLLLEVIATVRWTAFDTVSLPLCSALSEESLPTTQNT